VVSASVTGLSANTLYYFRISATNAGGTSSGARETFRTLPKAPPTVVTGSATAVMQASATLNATVNPNGGVVSGCQFEYAPERGTGGPGALTSVPCSPPPGSGTGPVAVSAPITGLSPGTTYIFVIVATNPAGTSSGRSGTFETPGPPTVVTGSATAVTQTSATLNATVNPNGETVSSCLFEYGTSPTSMIFSVPCTSLPGSGTSPVAVSAAAPDLIAHRSYYFRISATNPIGTSDGNAGTFTTLTGDLWFTNQTGNSIGRITTSGAVTNYTGSFPIKGPSGITTGPDDALWFTNQTGNSIGRITTGSSGSILNASINGPTSITAGPDGALWFTNQTGNSIGRITTLGVTNYTNASIKGPTSITTGPNGALWFTNQTGNSIGTITTSGAVTNYPNANIKGPTGITTGPNGALWFTNQTGNSIGTITTSGAVTNYTNASIKGPDGITAGP
jgi:streptogramin lyase